MGSDASFVDIDPGLLADWLEQQPPEKLWAADGEEGLAGAISFPCSGQELAPLLRGLGLLRAFVTPGARATWSVSHDVAALAQVEGEGLLFALGGQGDSEPRWLLVEDKLAESSARAAGM